MNFIRRNLLYSVNSLKLRTLRTNVHKVGNRTPAFSDSNRLKQLPEPVKQHDKHRFGIFSHGKCTDRCNGHKKFFVEKLFPRKSVYSIKDYIQTKNNIRHRKNQKFAPSGNFGKNMSNGNCGSKQNRTYNNHCQLAFL